MNTDSQVDWAKLAPQLADVARRDRAWYLTIACELVAPGDGSRSTSLAAHRPAHRRQRRRTP